MFTIRVVTELEEARKVWNLLSPKQNIYEDWDFRFVFYKYFNYPLRFYVGEENGEIIGLLALQQNTNTGYLEFFGGMWAEDNHVFIKPGFERYILAFYNAIKDKAKLEDIVIDNDFVLMSLLEDKYFIDLRGTNSLDDYLKKNFRAKRIKRFRSIIEEVDNLGVIIKENKFEDLDLLMDINIRNFGERSSFVRPHRREIYKELLSLYKAVMLTAEINGKKESISFAVMYHNTFVSLNSGTNKKDYPNLGSYMILKRIEKAIEMKAEIFDADMGEIKWKEIWHLSKIPQYKFCHD